MINRVGVYKRYIEAFGVYYGIKMIVMGWISHFTKKKIVFKIKSKNVEGYVYLRINTTDMNIANTLLGVEGEYDFLKDISGIEAFQCIVDVGANIGLFSMLARKQAPMAKIIAVEPESGNYEMCCKNIRSKGGDKIYHAGLWNKSTWLHIQRRSTGEIGFIVDEDKNGDIKAISMKCIFKECRINKIDLLKIDIEGSEYEVFDESSEKWIDKIGILVIETHDRIKAGCSERVDNRMKMHGFKKRHFAEYDVYSR